MNDDLKKKNLYNEELKPGEDSNKEQTPNDNNIAKNFPDWDLLPPYQTVRRITRK